VTTTRACASKGIVVNQYQARANLPLRLVDELRAEGLPILDAFLSASIKIRESHHQALPMIHLDPTHKLSSEFRRSLRPAFSIGVRRDPLPDLPIHPRVVQQLHVAELAQRCRLHVAVDRVCERTAQRDEAVADESAERMGGVRAQTGAEKTESDGGSSQPSPCTKRQRRWPARGKALRRESAVSGTAAPCTWIAMSIASTLLLAAR
jgi:hypothetical protein